MSTFAELLNVSSDITYKGKTYALRELTLLERAMVSRRLERRAEEALGRAFGRMPQMAWDAWSANLAADIAAGKYEYGGFAYAAALTTVDGWAYTLHLALRETYAEVTEEFAVQMVAELVGEKMLAQLKAIQAAGADPGNLSAPGASSRRPGKSSKSYATNHSQKRRKKSER